MVRSFTTVNGRYTMKVLDKFPDRPSRAKKVRVPATISPEELKKGCLAFQQRERRDAMYKTAMFLVKHFWGKPTEVAEGLGVLLCVWNNAFYRLGPFDYDLLEKCIAKNQAVLDTFRHRNILTHSPGDDRRIRPLFQEFLDALRICEGKCKGRASPVGVAKRSTCWPLASSPFGTRRLRRRMTATTTAIDLGSTWRSS